MIIYKAINKVNEKVYIGLTASNLDTRIIHHLKATQKGSNNVFHKALRKYGVQSFDFSVIDNDECKESLAKKEIYWIKYFDSKLPHGYNMTNGGDGVVGYKWTEEAKEKLSKTLTGRLFSKQHKKHISEATSKENHPFFGKELSIEHRTKISNSLKGHKFNGNGRGRKC